MFTPLPPPSGTVRDAVAFRAKMEQWKRHVRSKQHAVMRECMVDLLRRLVMANPVGDWSQWKRYKENPHYKAPDYVGGHSRRNWQIKTGPVAAELAGVDRSGTRTISQGRAAIARIPESQRKAWIVNPVPYMMELERGHSKIIPAGWIKRALAETLAKYRKVK
jgi:hypothetical protein